MSHDQYSLMLTLPAVRLHFVSRIQDRGRQRTERYASSKSGSVPRYCRAVLAQPRHKAFDAQVRPRLRGSSFAGEVYTFAEERTIEVMQEHEIEGENVGFEAWRCDHATAQLLESLGWRRTDDEPWTVNRIALADAPQYPLPAGYKARSVRGIHEAKTVAAVHDSAFPGVKWTEQLYRYVMESPGYSPERELSLIHI